MSLLTRCPSCSTLFRVTPGQLQARAGKVRCGRCMSVFDGFQALAVDQETAAAAAAPADASDKISTPPSPGIAKPASAEAKPSATVAAVAPPAAASPLQGARRASPVLAPRLPSEPPPAPVEPAATAKQTWAWASAALLVVLAMQALFIYRSELAARFPIVRSAYSAICDFAGCAVTLPQRPDLMKIEASDVHTLDTNRPGLIQLTATLRSYADHDLAYPALDLVLTNATEHALARRIFVPDEYLDATRDPRRGVPPRAEITVALDLDTAGLNAAGFRLDLLPAPAP